VVNNGNCTSVQVSGGGGGNIDADTCAGGSADPSTSTAGVTAGSTGTWSTVRAPSPSLPQRPIPTLSEWALILLSFLVAGCALRALSLRRRRQLP
jgi:hypothetical protein